MGQEPETTTEETSQEEAETTEAQEAESASSTEEKTFGEDYVKKLRDEAAKHRTEARQAQERLKEIEDAEKSEAEKAIERANELERERDEAVTRANDTLIRAAVVNEAAKQGAVDPDAALALLPKDAVTITDEGAAGAEQAVKDLLEAKPYLLGDQKKPPAGSAGGGVREDTPTMTPEEARQLAKTNPGEFNKKFEAGEIPASAMGS